MFEKHEKKCQKMIKKWTKNVKKRNKLGGNYRKIYSINCNKETMPSPYFIFSIFPTETAKKMFSAIGRLRQRLNYWQRKKYWQITKNNWQITISIWLFYSKLSSMSVNVSRFFGAARIGPTNFTVGKKTECTENTSVRNLKKIKKI